MSDWRWISGDLGRRDQAVLTRCSRCGLLHATVGELREVLRWRSARSRSSSLSLERSQAARRRNRSSHERNAEPGHRPTARAERRSRRRSRRARLAVGPGQAARDARSDGGGRAARRRGLSRWRGGLRLPHGARGGGPALRPSGRDREHGEVPARARSQDLLPDRANRSRSGRWMRRSTAGSPPASR